MKPGPGNAWTAESVLGLARNYQGAAVLAAAAELDLFSELARKPTTAAILAERLQSNRRGMMVLLDALTALRLLEKREEVYAVAPGLDRVATREGEQTVLAMLQHLANCLRNWAQLALVVRTGKPAPDIASVRGDAGDQEAFIGAMHNVSAPVADEVIRAIQPLRFAHLLDIGGASGTWTIAFLRACPEGRATLFDLPHVIEMARTRLDAAGFLGRVELASGSFYEQELPHGADLAWVSAIVHQNSREQNRELFARVFRALVPGGRIAIRDILMEPGRTQPVAGALFAINMLTATEGGGTFTFEELQQDLAHAGFESTTVARHDDGMNGVVVARKPGRPPREGETHVEPGRNL